MISLLSLLILHDDDKWQQRNPREEGGIHAVDDDNNDAAFVFFEFEEGRVLDVLLSGLMFCTANENIACLCEEKKNIFN